MRNTDTGEFELVVGNRQLLSGFFLVVLLFAVAFAMGYVVGQNSPKTLKAEQANAAISISPNNDRTSQAVPAPTQSAPPPIVPDGVATKPSTEQPQTPQTTAPAVQAPPVAAAPGPEAAPGTYWQVMAVAKEDAEVVVRTLKDKGFPASMTQGPNNLMRVLVGPYSDRQAMGKAKTELENLGLRPILR